MDIVVGLLIAVALGVLWVVLMRRSAGRRRLLSAPRDVTRVLDRYRKGDWAETVAEAPGLLARPSDGGDETWRPALELALGHSLVEVDRFEEAVPHLERGLLLQSAVRRAQGRGDAPDAGEAKLRHVLGFAYARTGRTAQARREYRRVLDIPGLDPAVRVRVEASLDALR